MTTGSAAEHFALAARTAECVLRHFGVALVKRLDLSTPAGFDRAVAALAAELRGHAARAEADAVRAAIGVLDVDWRRTTASERRRLISTALVAAGRNTALVPTQIRASLADAARRVVTDTRSHAREQGLAIAADFNAVDRRVIAHVVRSQGNFVRNEYGRRLDAFGQRARDVVAAGLERGLGRADIAAELQQAARSAVIERAPFYWEVVAGSFIGRGRSNAQTSAYAEAGIERYQIVAVLDERTTACCRFMNGKVFAVRAALDQIAALEELADPESIKAAAPWVRERGGRLYVDHSTGRISLADVLRSGVGQREDTGEFQAHVDASRLAGLGLSAPPFHALCRSTSVPLL